MSEKQSVEAKADQPSSQQVDEYTGLGPTDKLADSNSRAVDVDTVIAPASPETSVDLITGLDKNIREQFSFDAGIDDRKLARNYYMFQVPVYIIDKLKESQIRTDSLLEQHEVYDEAYANITRGVIEVRSRELAYSDANPDLDIFRLRLDQNTNPEWLSKEGFEEISAQWVEQDAQARQELFDFERAIPMGIGWTFVRTLLIHQPDTLTLTVRATRSGTEMGLSKSSLLLSYFCLSEAKYDELFSRLIRKHLFPLYHLSFGIYLRRRFSKWRSSVSAGTIESDPTGPSVPPKAPDAPQPGVYAQGGFSKYDGDCIMAIIEVIGTLISSMLPISSITILYGVTGLPAHLGIILGYTELTIFTKARRVEIFAAASTYLFVDGTTLISKRDREI
ncbi:hypothetical protein V8E51_004826 [Hyaloscypha variabilis]